MENNTKTQIEKLLSEMAEKHDYLQALESTSNAARDLSIDCLIRLDICKLYNMRCTTFSFLQNLAKIELNLLFLHKTLLYDCEEEYEKALIDIVKKTTFKDDIRPKD